MSRKHHYLASSLVAKRRMQLGCGQLVATLLLFQAWQGSAQFVNVRGEQRLIFTAAGMRQAIGDPAAGLIVLASTLTSCCLPSTCV